MSVRHGPVTLLSVVEEGSALKLLVAQGESVPDPILDIVNANSCDRCAPGARAVVEAWNAQGRAHHCAVGVDHVAEWIWKLGALKGVRVVDSGWCRSAEEVVRMLAPHLRGSRGHQLDTPPRYTHR